MDAAGYTAYALAAEVADLAGQRGHPQVRPDGSRVGHWLRDGERPRPPVPELVADLLSDRVGRRLSPADLGWEDGVVTPLTAAGWGAEPTAAALGRLIDADLRGATSGETEVAAGELLAHLQTWAIDAPAPLPTRREGGRRIGSSDVRRIEQVTDVFRALDNRQGGGASRLAVAGQLADVVAVARDGIYTDRVGAELFRALGDLAGVAGWMAHDAGCYPRAVEYLGLAVHAARLGGDRPLGAHLLQCLARVYGYRGDPDTARECIDLALYGVRRERVPVVRAGLHALAGRFAAMLGQERDTLEALARALGEFDPGAGTVPPYAAYLDQAELSSTVGEVRLFLARSTGDRAHLGPAVELLRTAAELRAEERIRSRVFDWIGLARGWFAAGDLDGACAAADQALRLAGGLDSARVAGRLRDLERESRPYQAQAPVAELRERLAAAGASPS
ncbi:transcriptional regulator [Bailinhaonella thermotolerans]|uniref:Transcriptional regulator n=2 Tax=Bailinhaonella thermotolerans TaxID=1070861 RepID=A0A3A4A376_9ACTN|nr:transcriptional regulator [Bailinhaonella thermotolerans]